MQVDIYGLSEFLDGRIRKRNADPHEEEVARTRLMIFKLC